MHTASPGSPPQQPMPPVADDRAMAPPAGLVQSTLAGHARMPLVLSPKHDRSVSALAQSLSQSTPWVAQTLRKVGALLLRGFDVTTPEDFERVARAISPDLKNNYLGTSPRDAVTPYVFNASELPPYYPIPQHCEMTFVKEPPTRIFFCCLTAPPPPGGETPLCDFRRVYADLDPTVRQRFDERGVRIIRNYSGPDGGSRLDLWHLKRWDEMFQTTDRQKIEATCRQNDFVPQWLPGGKLRLLSSQPASRLHPETGERVWFNHTQVFHLSAAGAELQHLMSDPDQREPVRMGLLTALSRSLALGKRLTQAPLDLSMHAEFADGTAISDQDMDAVRAAIWKNLVVFRWQAGDVVALDNHSISHGRRPFHGPRKVVVCWS